MNLRTKILLIILIVSFVLFGAIIAYISNTMKTTAINEAKKHIQTSTKAYANAMSSKFDYQIGITETYVNAISDFEKYPLKQRIKEDAIISKKIIKANPEILAIWSSWKLSTIDSTWNFDYGRQAIGLFRDENGIKALNLQPREVDGENISINYSTVRDSHKNFITKPYKDIFESERKDSLAMVSLIVPIIHNNNFKGIGGIDLNLEYFSNLIEETKFPFEEGYAFFVSNKGEIIAFNDKNAIGKSIATIDEENVAKYEVLENIANGKAVNFQASDKMGNKFLVFFHPVKFRNIKQSWAIGLVVPINIVVSNARNEYNNIIMIGIIGLIIFLIIAITLSNYITKPLIKIRMVLDKISKGEILNVDKIKTTSKDEIGKIIISTNTLISRMRAIAKFSNEMGKGNLHSNYKLSSKNDVLGNAIQKMQKHLIEATHENEKRREEDRRITWTTTGLAKFSELLRQNSNDVDEFSYSIISNLVEYLEANQGAIFLINDKNKNNMFIEKKGAYAYSNRKYEEQSFEMGVGLVGRCILEKQTIYLTDIPDDYITITSGLGENTPNCLVLIPLKYNDIIYGVTEIASFKNIEDYQITFLEKIGESIASSISGIKVNSQTSKLLDESQMQSEMLSSQEEEMRQNLEEMRATQEQLQDAVEQSKEKEKGLANNVTNLEKDMEVFERLFDAVAYSIYYKDMNGKYLNCNTAYTEVLGFDKNEIIGRTDFQFLSYEDAQKFEEIEKNVIKDKKNEISKILFTTKAGHVFNGLQDKKVLYDKSNRLMGSITILIPINVIDLIK